MIKYLNMHSVLKLNQNFMNYVFVAIDYSPKYLKYALNSIQSIDQESKVFVFSNQKIEFKNVEIININEIKSEYIDRFNSLNIYKNSIFENNPLWKTSSLRVLYLNEVKNLININSFVHVDNDVIIYKSFDEIKSVFDEGKLNITSSNLKSIIYGYSYYGKNLNQNLISSQFINEVEFGIADNWMFNNGKPLNEMQILSRISKNKPEIFNHLNILPYDGSNILFDPSSYGQYLDGTHNKPKKIFRKGHFSLNDYIGTEIISGRIKVKFKNNMPFVIWNKQKFFLANLHIHSKRLHKFLPKNYKDFS
mgnify:CR=1 FL=1